jgi:hypothetical protein
MAYRDGLGRSWLGNMVFHRHFGPENSGLTYTGVEDRSDAGDVEEPRVIRNFKLHGPGSIDKARSLSSINRLCLVVHSGGERDRRSAGSLSAASTGNRWSATWKPGPGAKGIQPPGDEQTGRQRRWRRVRPWMADGMKEQRNRRPEKAGGRRLVASQLWGRLETKRQSTRGILVLNNSRGCRINNSRTQSRCRLYYRHSQPPCNLAVSISSLVAIFTPIRAFIGSVHGHMARVCSRAVV